MFTSCDKSSCHLFAITFGFDDSQTMCGILYLIPAPLADGVISALPSSTTHILSQVGVIFTEERKSTIRYIRQVFPDLPLQGIQFLELNEHTKLTDLEDMLQLLQAGNHAALVSEAGLPCVADPGAQLVARAHAAGIRVVPMSGPSSLFLALMASGFNGQQFTFHGYLPRKPDERNQKIRVLERECLRHGYTQIFIETPYRNPHMMEALISQLQSNTLLCIACEITGCMEWVQTHPMHHWKKHPPDLHKKNCVFLLGQSLD